MRYDFVHAVTHRRLLTETNKSSAAIGRRGMIASGYKQDQQNQLLGRRRAFRVLCRSDLLPGSTIASVVRSEVLVPCAVYAGAARCQADAHRLIRSAPELALCSREEEVCEGDHNTATVHGQAEARRMGKQRRLHLAAGDWDQDAASGAGLTPSFGSATETAVSAAGLRCGVPGRTGAG